MALGKHPLPFSKLWELIQSQQKHCNTVYYHPCCDIWTTKNSRSNRVSHSQFITWRDILHSLPSDCADAQRGLQVKMIEEGWSLPAIVNKPCRLHTFVKARVIQNVPNNIEKTVPEVIQGPGQAEYENNVETRSLSLPSTSQKNIDE